MVLEERINTRLQLVFQTGYNDEVGEVETKSKSFNNINTSATTEQLLAVTEALATLQQFNLHEVRRNDTTILSND
ncbi:Protein of unknown function [Amphibacillus marinus]|uniref:DUF1659 domain-containing protein n=1 Tax=Amphibacillus marinus TaxID=872970 RepID=A0A1H8IFY4_9BACI|nr:DUF1659 domain-containing protein [Amphibacillus marinus]SEN67444.1 Protein of unknown function [Amphibacillus marinus]